MSSDNPTQENMLWAMAFARAVAEEDIEAILALIPAPPMALEAMTAVVIGLCEFIGRANGIGASQAIDKMQEWLRGNL